jgi:hypothetical protein
MSRNGQSYQEVSAEVKKEVLVLIKEPGLFFPRGFDPHAHFLELQKKEPNRFAGLFFDTSWSKPFSKDLSDILLVLKMSGFLTDISL